MTTSTLDDTISICSLDDPTPSRALMESAFTILCPIFDWGRENEKLVVSIGKLDSFSIPCFAVSDLKEYTMCEYWGGLREVEGILKRALGIERTDTNDMTVWLATKGLLDEAEFVRILGNKDLNRPFEARYIGGMVRKAYFRISRLRTNILGVSEPGVVQVCADFLNSMEGHHRFSVKPHCSLKSKLLQGTAFDRHRWDNLVDHMEGTPLTSTRLFKDADMTVFVRTFLGWYEAVSLQIDSALPILNELVRKTPDPAAFHMKRDSHIKISPTLCSRLTSMIRRSSRVVPMDGLSDDVLFSIIGPTEDLELEKAKRDGVPASQIARTLPLGTYATTEKQGDDISSDGLEVSQDNMDDLNNYFRKTNLQKHMLGYYFETHGSDVPSHLDQFIQREMFSEGVEDGFKRQYRPGSIATLTPTPSVARMHDEFQVTQQTLGFSHVGLVSQRQTCGDHRVPTTMETARDVL